MSQITQWVTTCRSAMAQTCHSLLPPQRPNFKTDFTSTQMRVYPALDGRRAGHSTRLLQRLKDSFCSGEQPAFQRRYPNVKQPTKELIQGTVMTNPTGGEERKGGLCGHAYRSFLPGNTFSNNHNDSLDICGTSQLGTQPFKGTGGFGLPVQSDGHPNVPATRQAPHHSAHTDTMS